MVAGQPGWPRRTSCSVTSSASASATPRSSTCLRTGFRCRRCSAAPQPDAWARVHHPPARDDDPALDGQSRTAVAALPARRATELGLREGARVLTGRDWTGGPRLGRHPVSSPGSARLDRYRPAMARRTISSGASNRNGRPTSSNSAIRLPAEFVTVEDPLTARSRGQAELRSSCSTARRIHDDSDRSSASARRRISSSSSGGNLTGTIADSRGLRRRADPAAADCRRWRRTRILLRCHRFGGHRSLRYWSARAAAAS